MIKEILESNDSVTSGANELEILKEYFPACFKGDGSFDIVRFQEDLKDKVNVADEEYELRFLGKNYARMPASKDVESQSTLRGVEGAKIRCAEVFFKNLSAQGYNVYFRTQLNNKEMLQIVNEIAGS